MAQPILPKNPDSPQSNAELFAIVLALHVPGQNAVADESVELCKLAMERKPNDPITREVLDTTIDLIVGPKDRAEIDEQIKQLTPEQRVIYDKLLKMSDE